jgi:hypothetical protein
MRNWTQLRETYKAILEAELLKGRSAILRQAELAKQGKPLAVKTLARDENPGPMSKSQVPGINAALPIEDPKQIPPVLRLDAKQVAREKLRWGGARGRGGAQYGAVEEPYDIDNIGFRDAQIRPTSTRHQRNVGMQIGSGGTLSLRPNPHFDEPMNRISSVKIQRDRLQHRFHSNS